MDEQLKSWTTEWLDGSLDPAAAETLSARLDGDPAARAEFADQIRLHHRLRVVLRDEDPVTAAVVRELKLLPDAPRFSQEVVDRVKRIDAPARRPWRVPLIAAAVFLAILGAVLFRRPEPPAPAAPVPVRKALFVVGRSPLGAGDAQALRRMETLSFAVTVIPSKQVNVTNALDKDLVVISSTALAEDVTDPAAELQVRFRDVPVPLLLWEPRLLHPLGMIEGPVHAKDWASTKGPGILSIRRPEHALASGLSGKVAVLRSPDRLSWGRAGAAAIAVASVDGDDSRACLFGYEKGAPMPGLAAPARRLSFFLFDHTARDLTPEGWRLFDAAVRWCADPAAR